MLVMRRRAGESFLIGPLIEIEVLEVCGARVKLGILAPDSVSIQRKETQITRDENITAARSVRQGNISKLLNKLVARPAACVGDSHEKNAADSEMHLMVGGKNARASQDRPLRGR